MIYSTLQSIGSRGKQPKDLRVNKSRDFLPGAKATILCCKPKIILNNWKKIRKQIFCENKSINEKTIWTNTYYNGRFQKWSSYSILTIFLVVILQNKWKFFGGSAMRWRCPSKRRWFFSRPVLIVATSTENPSNQTRF